ncbi:MAG: cytochrome c [Rhodobacteraceae bacterium]|jgi:mono/diheme cytochrome c family protein|nr:cytochrome c [Alphaproteobacteria bacterium]MBT8474902.1 cytochrome c [Alphaproteobacteria bacterium]NNK66445.1 cytochrome c [Paracoccaceae bacterium]
MKHIVTTAVALLVMSSAAAFAQQSIGQQEYMNSCAQCHGVDGTGGGPMVGYLTGSMPDLTTLQSENDGVFPVTKVYSVIDGTMAGGSHGSREMPIWGNRYRFKGAAAANPDFSTDEAETFTRFRILALTEYVSTLQQD